MNYAEKALGNPACVGVEAKLSQVEKMTCTSLVPVYNTVLGLRFENE